MTKHEKLIERLREFASEREWDKFHTPKNLAMALAVESGELMEIFQWLTEEESFKIKETDKIENVSDEMADVFVYLIRLADKLNIDLYEAVDKKMVKNEKKYPSDLVRGSCKKYSEY